jgi:DinB superfamily
MTTSEILVINFEEIRRRSIKLWHGIAPEHYFWKPDAGAMHCLEMVRHVLEGEYWFKAIVDARGDATNFVSPWKDRPYTNLQDELDFAKPFRDKFLAAVKEFTPLDLSTIEIVRIEKNQRRFLGDYLQRIAYHEAVHTGQMLGYLRTLRIEMPSIWD